MDACAVVWHGEVSRAGCDMRLCVDSDVVRGGRRRCERPAAEPVQGTRGEGSPRRLAGAQAECTFVKRGSGACSGLFFFLSLFLLSVVLENKDGK